jgi:hypothetical protein
MVPVIDFGIPGVEVNPGDHICGFFFGVAERDEILLPYLRRGLSSGDKCICIVDATDPADVVAGVMSGGDEDLEIEVKERLAVLRASEAYLRTGTFSTRDMIAFLSDAVDAAAYPRMRTAGERPGCSRIHPARMSSSSTNRSSIALSPNTTRWCCASTTWSASVAG